MKKEKKRLVEFEKQMLGRRWGRAGGLGGVSVSLGRARSPTERAEVRWSRPAL